MTFHSDMLCPFNSSEVRIEGLETLDYLDNLNHKERFTEQGDAITFESEVNFFRDTLKDDLMIHNYLNLPFRTKEYLNLLKLAETCILQVNCWIKKHSCRRI